MNWVISFVSYIVPTNQSSWYGCQATLVSMAMDTRLAGSTGDLDLSIVRTDLRCFVSLIKAKIHLLWQSEWSDLQLPNKIRQNIEVWDTAQRKNRREEVVLARLRVNATRLTHLTPYIDRNFPPLCQQHNKTHPNHMPNLQSTSTKYSKLSQN